MLRWFKKHGSQIIVGLIVAAIAGLVGLVVNGWLDDTTPPDTTPPDTTPPDTTPPDTTPPPSFLENLAGTWEIFRYREQSPNVVELGMDVTAGTLEIDELGNAYWLLEIDHGGPPIDPPPKIRCLGQVDVAQRLLVPVDDPIFVNGSRQLANKAPAGNMESFPADVDVAFCGLTRFRVDQLQIFDTTQSDYELHLDVAGSDRVPMLTMTNATGTLTWLKDP